MKDIIRTDSRFYETYYCCNSVNNIVYNRFDYLRELDEFYGDLAIANYLDVFNKYSMFHSFIEFVVDDIYFSQTTELDIAEQLTRYAQYKNNPIAIKDLSLVKLPIEMALKYHGFTYYEFGEFLSSRGKIYTQADDNDVYDYYIELRFIGDIDKIVDQTTREVFDVLFQNRELLMRFNQMMSDVLEREKNELFDSEYRKYFLRPGVLHRKQIPVWVMNAVYYRDKGRCVLCDKDLSGLLNLNNRKNFDHIIPLNKNGFNDISNIQLLCEECNQKIKHGNAILTSTKYQSWYSYD